MPTSTQVRRVLLQINADDGDTEAKLDAIAAKAEELSRLDPTLKPKIDTAAVQAKMRVLRDELKSAVTVQADIEDDAALAKAAELRAALDGLDAKAAGIKIKADDREAQAAILRVKAKLAALADTTADPKIKVSGVAKAEADIAAVSLELDKLDEKASGGGGGGFLSKLGGLFGGGGAAVPDAVPLAGGMSPMALGGTLAAVIPAIGAAVTEAAALASGFVAAGAGVGSFAALAMPAFKSVTGAYSQISTDQQAYDNALTKSAKNTAAKKLAQDWASLDPAERDALKGLQSLTSEFGKMSKAFEPTAFKVFDEGLKIANQLLPYLGAFANAAAPAIERLLTSLSKGLDSSRFKSFMSYMEQLAPKVITAVGSGLAGLAKDMMRLLTVMSQKDVVNGINIAFRVLGAALEMVIFVVKVSMRAWDDLTADVRWTMRTFDDVRHTVADWGHDIAHTFDSARHTVASWGHDVAHDFDTFRHDLAAVANWIKSHWREIVAWLVDPVGMSVYEIRTHTHQIASAFDAMRHQVSATLAGWRHDIASAFDAARHDVAAFVNWLPHAIASAWDSARHSGASALDGMRHDVASAWDSMRHSVASGVDAVLAEVKKLPGQILHELAALPGQMLGIGRDIVNGLIRGIESMAQAALNAAASLARGIEDYFTNPLKIFSPSKVFEHHGVSIVQGLINGIARTSPAALAQVRRLGQQVGGTGFGGGGLRLAGAASGGTLRLEVTGSSNDMLVTLLKKNVRVRGGDAAVLGR